MVDGTTAAGRPATVLADAWPRPLGRDVVLVVGAAALVGAAAQVAVAGADRRRWSTVGMMSAGLLPGAWRLLDRRPARPDAGPRR